MLKPGDQIGPYEIRGFLGQGGMGQVYRAFDPRLERTVALKVIVVPEQQPGSGTDSERVVGEFGARLLREARAVASLTHPNVVGIYDVGEHEGRLFFAMEYVVGTTLRSVVTKTDIRAEAPLSRKIRWLVDVARALAAAHRAGLVHRDVKPENVMVSEDGIVKVLDFGIARRSTGAGDDPHAVDTVTGGNAIVGTPVYMSPEQIKGGVIDARSDQFAWGVMAYELLSGSRPWSDAGDILAMIAKVLTDPLPPLRERTPACASIPQPVEDTIARALSREPKARFASMTEIADILEPFATMSTGGDRVRITPAKSGPPGASKAPEDATGFEATTRVPTSVSVAPAPHPSVTTKRSRRMPRWLRLAVPLALTGALAAAVIVVKTRPVLPRPPPLGTTRPLSIVPEAEAAYMEGKRLRHDGATTRGTDAFRRATELDPTFAAAYLEIALDLELAKDLAGAQAAMASAFENRHMLTPRDAALLAASEPFVRAKPDLEEWETRMVSVVFMYPRDAELQYYVGRARARRGEDEAAKDAFEKAVSLDPGLIPALAELAEAQRNVGHDAEAEATTTRCLEKSPVAATCVEVRFFLFSGRGECHKAREEASRWKSLEPQSPRALSIFARALFADGVPMPGVEEALAQSWAAFPAPRRKLAELRDRTNLAIVAGELDKAEELARSVEAELAPSADQYDHARPAQTEINILMELDRMKDASTAARGFLDRMDAWAVYPLVPDPSIAFMEPRYRAGELDKPTFDAARASWIEREKHRLPGEDPTPGRTAWSSWVDVWGGFAETHDEAVEALAKRPEYALPLGTHSGPAIDFNVGKVFALAGRPADAIAPLQRVTGSCFSFDAMMLVQRARYYLGFAYEAKGETGLARASYARVVQVWPPKATKSHTAAEAQKRLDAIGH